MDVTETVEVASREKWRAWLQKHHATKSEIWLIFFKKGSGRSTVTYAEAVEEALCFGWIDGQVRAVDEQCYAQRFTPRKAKSQWSRLNWDRVQRMIAAGRMTEAGAVHIPKTRPDFETEIRDAEVVPPELKKALRANKAAATYFGHLPPGYVRTALHWINDARRAETRTKRIAEFVRLCAAGKRIGMK